MIHFLWFAGFEWIKSESFIRLIHIILSSIAML